MNKQVTSHKSEVRSQNKEKLRFRKLFLFSLFFLMTYDLGLMTHDSFAQDPNQLVNLSKQAIEAKNNDELYLAFESLKDLYFKENKYNDFITLLNSLSTQKKELESVTDLYVAVSRYYQLKHLEEAQEWEEYFSQGKLYKEQVNSYLEKAIVTFAPASIWDLNARLFLWKLHKEAQDAQSEAALAQLMNSALSYAKKANDLEPLRGVAKELISYHERARAAEVYKVYVERLVTSGIAQEELKKVALDFYNEASLDLAEAVLDIYLEKEKSVPDLAQIAKLFAYKDAGPNDPSYAEKIFKKIDSIGTEDSFDAELMYLRGFNLEKDKDFVSAKDVYIKMAQKYAQDPRADKALFKSGIIYTYILADSRAAKDCFERLSQKEVVNPWVISSFYQLGLLAQWETDVETSRKYYVLLLDKAGNNFIEMQDLTRVRLGELDANRPIEYDLKVFLDASLKKEYAESNIAKLGLKARPYLVNKEDMVNIESGILLPDKGCLQVELNYLWSGDLGKHKASSEEALFSTSYNEEGTKVINLVVVSATGILDCSFDMVDVQ